MSHAMNDYTAEETSQNEAIMLRGQQIHEECEEQLRVLDREVAEKDTIIEASRQALVEQKANVLEPFGEVFVREVEESDLWCAALEREDEFRAQYLQHKFPFLRRWAELYLQGLRLTTERAALAAKRRAAVESREAQLRELEETRRHNRLLPGELYQQIVGLKRKVSALEEENRLIVQENRNLREDVQSLRAAVAPLLAREEEARAAVDARAAEDAARPPCGQFTLLGPNVHWNADTRAISKSGSSYSFSFAIAGVSLPMDRVSTWTVTIVAIPTADLWACLGIIGKTATNTDSYSHPLSFGFACKDQEYVKGKATGSLGFPNWQVGDAPTFTFNPIQRQLRCHLPRTNTTYTMSLAGAGLTAAHLHANVYFPGTELRVSEVQVV